MFPLHRIVPLPQSNIHQIDFTFSAFFALPLILPFIVIAVGVGESKSTKLEGHYDSTSRHRNCVGSHRDVCGKRQRFYEISVPLSAPLESFLHSTGEDIKLHPSSPVY